ncbi:class I SAM-dependent methyltransferase [Pseudoalteromonas xiamenensis]|uniref:class I SAM-dependent methyltransferase n=1 Tax=Pseudoalteromonas xiamenensis TaxID=882626 RepID=UPI0035EE45FB
MVSECCGLCGCSQLLFFVEDKRRTYLQCAECKLVFVPSQQHLSQHDEKAIYDQHENALEDDGYRHFLSRALEPVVARVGVGSCGLEFGCGPGPLLAKMLEERGMQVELYDLYYYPNKTVFNKRYDFITCTEVIEHVAQPKAVFEQLFSILKSGQPLVMMTKLVIDAERFSTWHYKNDLTHISFFSRETFEFVARQYNATLEIIGADVIVLTQ